MERKKSVLLSSFLRYVRAGWKKKGFFLPILVGGCFGLPAFWWALGMGTTMSPIEFGLRLWLSVTCFGWIYAGAVTFFDWEERDRERRRG